MSKAGSPASGSSTSIPTEREFPVAAAARAVTLHAPGLLGPWPAPLIADIGQQLACPGLAGLLRAARRRRAAPAPILPSYERLAFTLFGHPPGEGDDVPTAAVMWPGDAARAQVSSAITVQLPHLRADPVHLHPDLRAARLFDAGHFTLRPDEAAALVETLNQHFAPERLRFEAPCPERWYLWTDPPPEAVQFHPPGVAASAELGDRLPEGREGATWRRRMNEAQMALHAHPINLAREARGELPVNSVWFWGAGAPSTSAFPPHFNEILASDPLIRALGEHAGTPVHAPVPEEVPAPSAPGTDDAHLLIALGSELHRAVLGRDVEAWRRALIEAEARWFAPLREAMARGRVREAYLDVGIAPAFTLGGWFSRRRLRRTRTPDSLARFLLPADHP